ncbi:MAG: rhodanese-like domain-containing protein [Arenicellales bacterium]|jgi:rhodanese-related sulfurtransferase
MVDSKMVHGLKWLLTLIGISMLAACGNDEAPTGVNWSDLEQISQAASRAEDRVAVQQLAEWIVESKQDFTLVDIRNDKSYQDGHIDGAENIPMAMLVKPDSLKELSGKKVIVYSNGSENAAKATVMLRLMGLDSYLLSGGYNAWHQHVLNPDIPEQVADDEAPQVALQRAIACHFSGASARPPAEAVQPVESAAPAFTPPVFTPPAAPAAGGLIVDEGC